MIALRFALIILVAAAAAATPILQAHAACVPPLVAGVLVPLMLPRLGATLRRLFEGERLGFLAPAGAARRSAQSCCAQRQAAGEWCVCSPSRGELVRSNARLRCELHDLQAAYAQLRIDAAERTRAADRFSHLAHHDPLTKLPNRLLLMDRLTQAMAYARRAGTGVLVIYLDLDHFKAINDTMGHAAGDAVICEMGERISASLRATDTASRVGGDEFVLVCPTGDAAGDAAQIRARLARAIAVPVIIEGRSVRLSASVGMSVYPADGTTCMDLINRADQAMYFSKVRGPDPGLAPGRLREVATPNQRLLESRRYDDGNSPAEFDADAERARELAQFG